MVAARWLYQQAGLHQTGRRNPAIGEICRRLGDARYASATAIMRWRRALTVFARTCGYHADDPVDRVAVLAVLG